MPNDTTTLLKRRAFKPGEVAPTPVPAFPEIPKEMVARFPELRVWGQQIQDWVEKLNNSLSREKSG